MIQLMQDKKMRKSLAHAGRTAVEERYDWQHIFPRLERLYHEFVNPRQSAFL
jgi:glycosyltransferase involved in cell wall biosynthesis